MRILPFFALAGLGFGLVMVSRAKAFPLGVMNDLEGPTDIYRFTRVDQLDRGPGLGTPYLPSVVLAYAGEGFISAWYKGNIIEIDAHALFGGIDDSFDPCDPDKDSCWWWVEPGSHLENDWWAKIRLPGGTEGWARPDNFGNIDGCG